MAAENTVPFRTTEVVRLDARAGPAFRLVPVHLLVTKIGPLVGEATTPTDNDLPVPTVDGYVYVRGYVLDQDDMPTGTRVFFVAYTTMPPGRPRRRIVQSDEPPGTAPL